MLIVLLAWLADKTVLAADLVTVGSAMRACIYLVPLGLLVALTNARAHWLLKLALVGYVLVAFAAILGGSRELGNVLSLVPAAALAAYGVRVATRPPDNTP